MSQGNDKKSTRWTRRKMLGATAAMGAAGIAGCGGDGDGTPTETEGFTTDPGATDSPTATDEPGDGTDTPGGGGDGTWGVEEFVQQPACTPPNDNRFDFVEFSTPQEVNIAVNAGAADYTTFTKMSSIITEWTGWGAPDPDFKIPILYDEFTLNEDATVWSAHMVEDHAGWHDGSDLHINDFLYNAEYNNEYEKLTAGQADEQQQIAVEGFERTGDYGFNATLTEPQHPGVFFTGIPYPSPIHPAHEMESWWERMMDASSGSEAETIHEEYSNLSTTLADDPDGHVGNGRFQIDRVTDSFVDLVKWDEHKYADENNVETMRCHFFAGESAQRLAWEDGIPDFGYPPSNVDFPDKYINPRYPQIEGGGIDFNQWHDDFARRGFRKAIMYLSNFAGATRASANEGFPAPHWTGLPSLVGSSWIDDWESFRDSTIEYGIQSQTDKATTLLEDMGYTQEGGTWVNPDGDNVSFTVGIPNAWPERWGEHALRDQWRNFGFEVEYIVFEDGNWGGWGGGQPEYINPRNGHWDVTLGNRGPDNTLYPYTGFISDTNYYQGWQLTPAGQTYEDKEWTFANRQEEIEIPSEVGVESLDDAGSTETFNVREAQEAVLDPTTDRETVQEWVRQAAWAMNFDVPCNYINYDPNSFAGNAEDFHFPDLRGDGRPDNYYSNRLERGLIRGKCE